MGRIGPGYSATDNCILLMPATHLGECRCVGEQQHCHLMAYGFILQPSTGYETHEDSDGASGWVYYCACCITALLAWLEMNCFGAEAGSL